MFVKYQNATAFSEYLFSKMIRVKGGVYFLVHPDPVEADRAANVFPEIIYKN